MGGKTIIFGDVHGCFDELVKLLENIQFNKERDKVIFVGDLVGKGPKTQEVIQFAIDIGAKSVRGNHEDILIQYYRSHIKKEEGVECPPLKPSYIEIAKSLTPEQWNYLLDMPLYILDKELNALIVHAGVLPNVALEKQDPFLMMNMRNILPDGTGSKFTEEGGAWVETWKGPETVFFGHDAVRGIQIKKNESGSIIAVGLDTGACYGKYLSAFVLPDKKIVQQPSAEIYEQPIFSLRSMDNEVRSTLQKIPLLTVKAGPRDGDMWIKRLKQEYKALIEYVKMNKASDNDWFFLESNKLGTRWHGKCWYIHDYRKYEFDVQFEVPVTYPRTAIEIELPELEGKTAKMYRGGKICLTVHFKPLWGKNVPSFGIAHALAMGLAPWLAAEVPHMIEKGLIVHNEELPQSSPGE